MLESRKSLILKEVVDAYVSTATPVASRAVAGRIDLGLSSATIRNTMMELEKEGYLEQPHASAGRIPTDRGYRAYVDDLMEPEALSAEDEEWIEDQLNASSRDMTDLLDQAARLLGGACRQLGLVLAPSFNQGVLTGIELARVGGRRVLLVLRVRNGLVRTVVLDVTATIEPDHLAEVASRLSECLVGLTLEDIRSTLEERSRAWSFSRDEVVMKILDRGPDLFGTPDASALYVGGTTNMVSQPEFQSPEKLARLLEIVEERSGLSCLLENRRSHSGIHITIGGENPAGPLAATSIVTCTYTGGPLSGALGIIGPTRMPYRRVVGILERVVEQVDRRLGA